MELFGQMRCMMASPSPPPTHHTKTSTAIVQCVLSPPMLYAGEEAFRQINFTMVKDGSCMGAAVLAAAAAR